jgi:hypothetical protein
MILTAITIIIGALLLFMLYILLTPLSFSFDLAIGEKLSATSWLKLYPFRYRLYPAKARGEPKRPRPEKKQPARKLPLRTGKRLNFSKLRGSDLLLLLAVIGRVFGLLGRLFKTSERYFLKVDIAGGAPEPDITGELYGAYQAIRVSLPESIKINYVPDFMSERIRGRISCGFAVRPLNLFREGLIFIFHLPIIRLIKLYRRIKK